jgi:hypothetical protein
LPAASFSGISGGGMRHQLSTSSSGMGHRGKASSRMISAKAWAFLNDARCGVFYHRPCARRPCWIRIDCYGVEVDKSRNGKMFAGLRSLYANTTRLCAYSAHLKRSASMFRVSMPFVLLTLAACAQVTPAASTGEAAEAGTGASSEATPADAAYGGEASAPDENGGTPSSAAAPSAVEGNPGSGAVQPVPPEQIRVGPGIGENSCEAEAAQSFLGRNANEAVVKEAVRASGAKTVRVIPHDGMVTMDYRGDRLNIQLDPQGKIVAITCG